jgi:hypothetical protein
VVETDHAFDKDNHVETDRGSPSRGFLRRLVAQMLAALVERALRQKMAERKVDLLCSLPEGRGSKTPTIEQVLRLFEHQNKHALYDGERLIKQFADSLTPVQSQILQLLSISTAVYAPGN